jgi:uncharacterized protein (DUF2336 family)
VAPNFSWIEEMSLNASTQVRAHGSLIAELEDAMSTASREKRVETLRRVTDLFMGGAEKFNDEQVSVFDDVLLHLVRRMEAKVMAELSTRMAPVHNAPVEVVRTLARHDDIEVAGPVLTQSARLTSDDLVEIAQSKGQGHLLAIAGRAEVEEVVTDHLLQRGYGEVTHKLAGNIGARFSQTGFSTLMKGAETDEALAKKIGVRIDLPAPLMQELLSRATETVQAYLIANAPPETRNRIRSVLADVSTEVSREVSAPRDFTVARLTVTALQKHGQLNEAALLGFANTGKYEETVVALSLMASTSIQLIAALMRSDRNDGLLVACKAAGLKWPTVGAILKSRISHHDISDNELSQARASFLTLSQPTALRTLRFWQVRIGVSEEGR